MGVSRLRGRGLLNYQPSQLITQGVVGMTAGLMIARLKRLLRVLPPWPASVFVETCNCACDGTIQASLGLINIPVQFLVETGLPGRFAPTFSRLGLPMAHEAVDG